jgi:ribonuclease VapC
MISFGRLRCKPDGFDAAIGAVAKYGKGRHPVALGVGACYARACAETNNACFRFEGDDFIKRDFVCPLSYLGKA